MASRLWHPDTWAGRPWIEVMCNLAEALNERYYAGAKQFGFVIPLSSTQSYDRWLYYLARSIKRQIIRWYNHAEGLTPHINTQYLSWTSIRWTLNDVIADINEEPDFIDYEDDPLGNSSYRDMEKVLRQYYQIITRMKQCIILTQGVWGEGGNDFYHPWRDLGVYTKVSIESTNINNSLGSRHFSIRKEGMYGIYQSGSNFLWPDHENYNNPESITDIDHQNRLNEIYQWFPVTGYNLDFNAPGDFPDGPFFGRTNQVHFVSRAQGFDGTVTGIPFSKQIQNSMWTRHRINLEYFPDQFGLNEINGLPKKIKYLYHCDHQGTDNLQCPLANNITDFYEAAIDGNNHAEILFGNHPNPPASIDIPLIPAGGSIQAYQGFIVTDSGEGFYYIEEWDDGTDGALEYYEPEAP